MNTRTKGRNAENELAKMLLEQGYLVEQVKGSSKFNKSVDFFGQFDIWAFNKEKTLLIQVKSNSTAGAKKKIQSWVIDNLEKLPEHYNCIVAVRLDNKPINTRWIFHYVSSTNFTKLSILF
jgi:Holliday junction resolvase